jgi:hypothetical protein
MRVTTPSLGDDGRGSASPRLKPEASHPAPHFGDTYEPLRLRGPSTGNASVARPRIFRRRRTGSVRPSGSFAVTAAWTELTPSSDRD